MEWLEKYGKLQEFKESAQQTCIRVRYLQQPLDNVGTENKQSQQRMEKLEKSVRTLDQVQKDQHQRVEQADEWLRDVTRHCQQECDRQGDRDDKMSRWIESLGTKVDLLQPRFVQPASQGQVPNSAEPGAQESKEAISGVERHMERAKRIAKQAEVSLQGALAVAQEVTTKAGDVTVHAQPVHEELQNARQVYEDTVKLQEEVSRQTKTAVTRMETLHGQVTGLARKAAEEKKYYREKAEAMRKELARKMEEAQNQCATHISAAHTFETSLEMHAEQAKTIVEAAKAENERNGRQRQEKLTQARRLVQQHASQVWQWLQTANKEAEDHRNNLQKIHREVEERVTWYEEKVQQRGASGIPSPGTVDTQSSQCATQQYLETVHAHVRNKILQVKQDIGQDQETSQRAPDDVQGKQRHCNVELKTTVEKVQTTLNQKIQDMEKSVDTHHRKMKKEWRDTQEKLRHYESELLTTRKKKIQEEEHSKHATPDDADQQIHSIKDELEHANEVLARLKDQLETSSAENAREIEAITEEIERVKNNHREALERHKGGVKDQLENSTDMAREKYQQVQDHCMAEIRKVMDHTARFKEEVAEMVATSAESMPPKATASVGEVNRRPAEDTAYMATLFTVDASRTVASEAVRLRMGPSWMPSVKSEVLSWYNERYEDTTTLGWRQIEWLFTEDHFLVPGGALRPPPSRKGRSVRPTGIWECAAFLEVRPERQYGTETHELDPSKQDEPGVFGKEGHTWIDDETKNSMQQEAKVPHWDCTVETNDKWSKHFLKWRHRRRGRFSPAYQVDLFISVLDNKNFREAKEQQLQDEGVEDDFELAWNIVTGTVLPHEYRGKAEFQDLQIDVSQDMTSER